MADTAALLNLFAARAIILKLDWLEAVRHHARSARSGPHYDEYHCILQQWLQTDLRMSCNPDLMTLLPQWDQLQAESHVLSRPMIVQILFCHDIGHSIQAQIGAIENLREQHKPAERRLINIEAEDELELTMTPVTSSNLSRGTMKLHVEDAAGNRAYALERHPSGSFSGKVAPGTKLVVRECQIVHSVLLLQPEQFEVLTDGSDGGFSRTSDIDTMHQQLTQRLQKFPRATARNSSAA